MLVDIELMRLCDHLDRALDAVTVDNKQYRQANEALTNEIRRLREAAGKAADYLDASATCNSDKAVAASLRRLMGGAMIDFGKLYADEAHKKQVLLEELSRSDAEIESLRSRLSEAEHRNSDYEKAIATRGMERNAALTRLAETEMNLVVAHNAWNNTIEAHNATAKRLAEADAHIESLCRLVEWWAPKDGTSRTTEARAFLARERAMSNIVEQYSRLLEESNAPARENAALSSLRQVLADRDDEAHLIGMIDAAIGESHE